MSFPPGRPPLVQTNMTYMPPPMLSSVMQMPPHVIYFSLSFVYNYSKDYLIFVFLLFYS